MVTILGMKPGADLQRLCLRHTWYKLRNLKVCYVVVSRLGYPEGKNSTQAESITPQWGEEKPFPLGNYDHAQIWDWTI